MQRSMLKLYYTPGACSLAPHIALEEAGDRFALERVDLAANQQNSPDFLRLNPKARVPVLTDGDWALTEAPAILRYIAARHPAAGLWPWDPREEARCAEWLGWLSSTIHVSAGHVRRAARYASDARAVEDVAATGRNCANPLTWRRRRCARRGFILSAIARRSWGGRHGDEGHWARHSGRERFVNYSQDLRV